MRKKLETRRLASRDSDKLAIESKSVVDFKVPEIPIKKIQEIYKSSDLLRSKSESDIIATRSDHRRAKPAKSNDVVDKDSPRSRTHTTTTTVESKSSLYTVNDDDDEEESSDYSATAVQSYKTKSNSEEITQRNVAEVKRSSSQSSNISEEIPTEAYSERSQTEQVKTATSSRCVSERLSKESPTNIEEDLSPGSDDASLVFSRKLDNIQLHNKELNDDIHNLEHDLKELTDMMTNFSKKSRDSSSGATSKVVTEDLPRTEDNVDRDLQSRVERILSDVAIPETEDLLTSIEELDARAKSSNSGSSEVLSDGVKLVLVEQRVNRSTVSEEIPTELPSNALVERDDSKRRESEVQSVSEVMSIIASEEDKENLSPNESPHYSVRKVSSSDASSQIEAKLEKPSSRDSSNDISSNRIDPAKIEENEPTINTATEEDKISSAEEIVSEEQVISSRINDDDEGATTDNDKSVDGKIAGAREISADKLPTPEKAEEEVEVEVEVHQTSAGGKSSSESLRFELDDTIDLHQQTKPDESAMMEDSAMFLPKGESTNLETFVLRLDDESSEQPIGIRSDEFNDILEIIDRETKNTSHDEDDEPTVAPAILSLTQASAALEYDVSIRIKTTEEAAAEEDQEEESIEEEIEGKVETSEAEDPSSRDGDELLEIGVKIQVTEEDAVSSKEALISEVGSSDGEQLDNLIEVAEGKLDTVEVLTPSKDEPPKSSEGRPKTQVTVFLNRTFEVIKDPEYEDISEESLEVSEILDKTETSRVYHKSKKFTTVPEKYVIKPKSDEVLRILDELSNQSRHEAAEEIVVVPREDGSPKAPLEESEPSSGEGCLDTPRGVPEIELDSPRDVNENSRLDVEALDDDLLSGNEMLVQQQQPTTVAVGLLEGTEGTTEFRTTPMGVTSEKDIEAMIEKLKGEVSSPFFFFDCGSSFFGFCFFGLCRVAAGLFLARFSDDFEDCDVCLIRFGL